MIKVKFDNVAKGRMINMKIVGIYNINNTDEKLFHNDLTNAINILQNDGQEVKVQYQVNSFPNGQIVLSALVLGRK